MGLGGGGVPVLIGGCAGRVAQADSKKQIDRMVRGILDMGTFGEYDWLTLFSHINNGINGELVPLL
jgi:hypothetical protein